MSGWGFVNVIELGCTSLYTDHKGFGYIVMQTHVQQIVGFVTKFNVVVNFCSFQYKWINCFPFKDSHLKTNKNHIYVLIDNFVNFQ